MTINRPTTVTYLLVPSTRAAERGGRGGDNDPGAHGLQGGPFCWRSPKFDRKNSQNFGEDLFLFFFGDHLNSSGKTGRISVKTFFF